MHVEHKNYLFYIVCNQRFTLLIYASRFIVEMILFPVVNEACRVLDEGVVIRASDLDVASVLGMSFPSYR